jgi:hypothetical protein
MSGSVADLKKARTFFSEFLKRAGCAQKPSKKRGAPKCRPGRMQNIDISVEAMQVAG